MIDDRPEFVVARTLKRLYPQNPDVVLGREARNIVADLSTAGWQLATDLFLSVTGDIKAENEELRAICGEAMVLLREVWTAGSAEGRLRELWNLAGKIDAILSPGSTPLFIPEESDDVPLDATAPIGPERAP